MIFTSLALLVVATILLIAGIMKSSVALLVLSVIATLAGCATLYASFVYYRRKAEQEEKLVAPVSPHAVPLEPGATTVTGMAPAGVPTGAAVPNGAAVPTAAAPLLVNRAVSAAAAATIGWDHLDEGRAVQLVETLNLDELHDLRRHEVEHVHRPAVLAAIDARIETIVALRRSASAV